MGWIDCQFEGNDLADGLKQSIRNDLCYAWETLNVPEKHSKYSKYLVKQVWKDQVLQKNIYSLQTNQGSRV